MPSRPSARVITRHAGPTYCAQAGFTLRDKPAPLYQLVMLASLLAKPISADLAVAAAGELRRAGLTTPARTLDTTWQQRVDALGRAHYRRYDESMATIIAEAAQFLLDRYRGDLRRLADAAHRDRAEAAGLLTEIPGIGPTAADIVLREAQRVWPWLRPYLDEKVLDGARVLGLPHSARGLRRWLADEIGDGDPAEVAAALVRVGRNAELAEEVRTDRGR